MLFKRGVKGVQDHWTQVAMAAEEKMADSLVLSLVSPARGERWLGTTPALDMKSGGLSSPYLGMKRTGRVATRVSKGQRKQATNGMENESKAEQGHAMGKLRSSQAAGRLS